MENSHMSLYELWMSGVPSNRWNPKLKGTRKKNTRYRFPEGFTPKRTPRRHGLIKLTPEQLASLVVEVKDPTTNEGYQRVLEHKQVAEMMAMIDKGALFPPPLLAFDADLGWVIVDGQHRALAHALSNEPLLCCLYLDMSVDQRRQLFRDQRKAKKVGANHQTLNEDSPLALLVQSVFTDPDTDLAYWSEIARCRAMGENLMFLTMGAWLTKKNTRQMRTYESITINKESLEQLEQLGSLLREALKSPAAYKTNWKAYRVRAVTRLALAIWSQCKTPEQQDAAAERWGRVFPKFDWNEHQHLTSQSTIVPMLIQQVWNKRLAHKSHLYIK